MSVSVRQQFADRIRFVVVSAVYMETLNTAVAFEDVTNRLNVGTPQIMEGHNVMGTIIDEEDYQELESNHPAERHFVEGERPEGFQVTAVLHKQLLYIFWNANTISRDQISKMNKKSKNIFQNCPFSLMAYSIMSKNPLIKYLKYYSWIAVQYGITILLRSGGILFVKEPKTSKALDGFYEKNVNEKYNAILHLQLYLFDKNTA